MTCISSIYNSTCNLCAEYLNIHGHVVLDDPLTVGSLEGIDLERLAKGILLTTEDFPRMPSLTFAADILVD